MVIAELEHVGRVAKPFYRAKEPILDRDHRFPVQFAARVGGIRSANQRGADRQFDEYGPPQYRHGRRSI